MATTPLKGTVKKKVTRGPPRPVLCPDLLEDRLERLIRHVNTVRDYCELLGKRLIESEEVDFGLQLISNGMIHDASKFNGIEWLYLHEKVEQELFDLALLQHVTTNKHHPEYWHGGVKEMPRLYVAEMTCDWRARATEFSSSLRDWIDGEAKKRYGFSKDDEVYEDIIYFADLLSEKPFSAAME